MGINTMEVETEAFHFCVTKFKMKKGHHVFHSKPWVKGLGMSHVIDWFFCLHLQFRSPSSHPIISDRIRSGISRKRKRSDPCDSDFVDRAYDCNSVPPFYSHWNRKFLTLVILTPLPIPLPVWTSPNKTPAYTHDFKLLIHFIQQLLDCISC